MDCIFCKLAKESEKIYENDNFFSVFDVNPQVKGHALIISKKHFENVLDLPGSLGSELLDAIKKTSLKLMKDFNARGFNVVNNTNEVAQQIVPHVHFHILPRKKDDSKVLSLKDG